MKNDDLGSRMKEYERASQRYLTRRTPVILRIDGCHFHTFTRGFHKPFDDVLIKTMQETTKYLCENIQGCVLGYTQSDEITLVLIDYKKLTSSAWFDNRQNKIESVAASMATMAFNRYFVINVDNWGYDNMPDWEQGGTNQVIDPYLEKICNTYLIANEKGACFDCRAFNIPKEEVTNNIYWRQLDASRNSIQMLGQANFSHKELQNKSCNQIKDMLVTEKNINWDDLPTHKKRGSCVIRVDLDKSTENRLGDSDLYRPHWIIDEDIPQFKGDGREYIENLIR